MNKKWNKVEEDFIRNNANSMTDAQMAKELSHVLSREVSMYALRKKRQKLGIKKCHGRGICKVVTEQEFTQ